MRLTKFLVAVALVIGLTSKLLAQAQPPGTLAWKNGFPAATNAQPGQFFGFVDVQGTFTVNAGWKVSIAVAWIPNPAPRGAQPMGRGVDPFLGNWGENKVAFPGGPPSERIRNASSSGKENTRSGRMPCSSRIHHQMVSHSASNHHLRSPC